MAVVGAGQSGLSAAAALAEAGVAVVLVERLPAPGGQEPDGAATDALIRRAAHAGVEMLLGTLAVEWDGEALSTLGVSGARRLTPAALIVATGTRPATRAELRIDGDRFAGVVPGSAALHLTEAGVLLGHRPVVVGAGSLAASVLAALRHAGAHFITLVAPDGVLDPGAREADAVLEGWTVDSAHGNPRVEAVVISRAESRERLATDALVLAHRRVPMRNIEGAIGEGSGIFFCQPQSDPKTLQSATAEAERAVAATMAALGQ